MQAITPQVLSTTVLLIMLLTPVLTLPIAFGLLRLYRRAVLRGMSASTSDEGVSAPFAADLTRSASLPDATGTTADDLYHRVLRAPWYAVWRHAAAGMAFALVMAIASFIAWRLPAHVPMFLLWWWSFAWPVVLTTNMMVYSTWRTKVLTTVSYGVILVGLMLLAMSSANLDVVDFGMVYLTARSTITPRQTAFAWSFSNIPPTLLLLAVLCRPIRAVGPLLVSFMTVVVGGVIAVYWGMFYRHMPDRIVALTVWLDLDVRWTLLGIVGLALGIFGAIGWGVLIWLRRGYRRKTMSDQSLTLDAVWLLFGMFYSILLLLVALPWGLTGLVAFAVYKLVTRLGNRLLARQGKGDADAPTLLFLRVFALGKRSERLFDAVAKHWRYLGTIQFITGPDLVTTTVGPHQFLDYLSGRLARLFISGQAALDDRMRALDTETDRDGRFRINDFFCRDDTWQGVLSRLVQGTHVVLMDLRHFTPSHDGCRHELNELMHVMPLPQVVLVVDDSTDRDFLDTQLDVAWKTMPAASPNRNAPRREVQLLQLNTLGQRHVNSLLRRLCAAAA